MFSYKKSKLCIGFTHFLRYRHSHRKVWNITTTSWKSACEELTTWLCFQGCCKTLCLLLLQSCTKKLKNSTKQKKNACLCCILGLQGRQWNKSQSFGYISRSATVLCHFPTLPLVFIRRVKNKEMEYPLVSLFYCNTAEYCYYTYRHNYSHVKKGYTCPREH